MGMVSVNTAMVEKTGEQKLFGMLISAEHT